VGNNGSIELVKLKNGDHDFAFEFSTEDFESYSNRSFEILKVKALVHVHKNEHIHRVNLTIEGITNHNCDYCLSTIEKSFANTLDFIIKLTETEREDDEDNEIYYVTDANSNVSFIGHVYDLIFLALPMQITCDNPGKTSQCAPEMIAKLSHLNLENEENKNSEIDPRWDKLKDLLN